MKNSYQTPLDGQIDFKQIKLLTNTLLDSTYSDIIQKYDQQDFFSKVFADGVDADITLLRDMTVMDFLPKGQEAIKNMPAEKRELALRTLANANSAADAELKLKQIDPTAVLPANFDFNDYHQRASQTLNALQSIKMAIAEKSYTNYLDDTTRFCHTSPERLKEFRKEIEEISGELQKEFENLIGATMPNPSVINKAADLAGRMGRIPIFVDSLKERKNLGDIAELILKLRTSLLIASDLQAKGKNNLSREEITQGIKNYLVEKTFL